MSNFKNHKWSGRDDSFDFIIDDVVQDDHVMENTVGILNLMRDDNIGELPKIAVMLLMLTDYALINKIQIIQEIRDEYINIGGYEA